MGALRAFAEVLDQKGECGVVAAATCDLLLVPRKAVLKWLDDCLAVEAQAAVPESPRPSETNSATKTASASR